MAFFNDELINELKTEGEKTRKILALVPFDKLDYAPHEKSMKMGVLAFHVAGLPEWVTITINQDELDFATQKFDAPKPQNADELLERLDKNVADALAAIKGVSEETWKKPWTLRSGEHVIMTLPKSEVVRSFAINHLIHHRAQLGTYLRMLDIPIPGMYGSSADEK
ncbi:MAG: DinB family protein [Chitinophagaceae bacterium]